METKKSDAEETAGVAAAPGVREGQVDQHRPRNEGSRRTALVSTLEGEIVPRLLMLCRSADPDSAAAGAASTATDPGDVEELARLLLAHGPELACEFVAAVRERGVPFGRICLGLFVPAAHLLAERWERRELGFADLMRGLDALHAVILEISAAARRQGPEVRGDLSDAFLTVAQRYQ